MITVPPDRRGCFGGHFLGIAPKVFRILTLLDLDFLGRCKNQLGLVLFLATGFKRLDARLTDLFRDQPAYRGQDVLDLYVGDWV